MSRKPSRIPTQLRVPVALAIVALVFSGWSVLAWASSDAGEADIVDTAVAAGDFDTLVAAVKAADLVETLKGDGPFTVFAPTNAAFDKLPAGTLDSLLQDKEQLRQILTYHVVPGKVMASDVAGLSSATTVQGGTLSISTEDGVQVGSANVIKTDIVTSNGVIHVIDTVLIPSGS